ncbi:cupin domain-containing protein [Zoogloea sp.]|uniref:cupin domain-containing protein n=1 Tax=Zoogloea sp. TaxID=49181 RepID=UPI0025FB2D26|nr:cupin domain-containing protein [Zoogloea sp.]MCK6396133.1 cupin domain-containing protein [Zoogloea sp.]
MQTTRIVTGHDADGHADFALQAPLTHGTFQHHPGFVVNLVWQTGAQPGIPASPSDPVVAVESVLPQPGGTTAMVVSFPPDSVMSAPHFDPAAAGMEFAQRLPGLAESFDPDGSGFHQTDTMDYGVVLEGEIWLDLDDGRERHLKAGDVVVQLGTRHAWRNRSEQAARMFFVLIGATRG